MDYPREYLEIVTARVRSERPLVHDGIGFPISKLKDLGLLENRGGKYADGDFSISTKIAGHKGTCTFRIQELRDYVVGIESRPSVCGPAWYFRDAEAGRLVKSICFIGQRVIGRQMQGALYASQFQSKAYRGILKLEKLTRAIEGDPARGKGPARGQSRLKKLAMLRRTYNDLRLDQTGKQKAIASFPQFKKTIQHAGGLLRRELPKLPKGWDQFHVERT